MADCECQCAEGAPVGWRRIPGGGRGLPFGRPFGPGFGGGFGANNNNNNNNNNSSNNNNANNMMSALNSLLGLNSLNGLSGIGGFGPGLGGFGFPFGGGGGLPFGGFGPGFFPTPGPGCCGPAGQDCCAPGPCCCGPFPPGPPPDCRSCNSVCWKQFKIVSPNGQECCFPVAVPWWCCESPTGPTGATGAEGSAAEAEAPIETVGQVLRETPAEKGGCMSASQLLMQRYMIASPPRAFGQGDARYAGEPEIIDCPGCGEDGESPQFDEAMTEFQRSAVLIPSESSVYDDGGNTRAL